MRWPLALTLLAVTGVVLDTDAQQAERTQGPINSYYPAFYSAGAAFTGSQKLVIFPAGKEAVSAPLPFSLGRLAFAPNGKALYAHALVSHTTPARTCLYKIEFNPIHATLVPGTCDLKWLHSISVSSAEDKVLVSGGYLDGGSRHCGVFEISLPQASVRTVLETSDC